MGSPTSDNSFAVTESMDMDDCGVSGCYVERSNHGGCSLHVEGTELRGRWFPSNSILLIVVEKEMSSSLSSEGIRDLLSRISKLEEV